MCVARYGSNVTHEHQPASPLTSEAVALALTKAEVITGPTTVLTSTPSTNDVASQLAGSQAPAWTVVVAEHQTAGRGRLGRQWEAPRGSALLFSVVLRPPDSWLHELGWIPLLSGLAVADAICTHGLDVALKWPNDVVVAADEGSQLRKVSGLLSERRDNAVIVGIGINVKLSADELPVPTATALNLEGVAIDRATLLAEVLEQLQERWNRFVDADGDVEGSGLSDQYRQRCISVGRRVRVDVPASSAVEGTAVDVDGHGHLVVDTGHGTLRISAGDVHHLV